MTNAAVHDIGSVAESVTEFRNHIGCDWTRSARGKTFVSCAIGVFPMEDTR